MFRFIRVSAAAATIAIIATSGWTSSPRADAITGAGSWLGVKVAALNPGWREQYSYSGAGVRVTDVESQSPADRIGIVRGDILVAVGSTSLKTEDDLATARTRMDPSQSVAVIIARHNGSLIKIRNLDPATPVSEASTDAAAARAAQAATQDPLAMLGIQCAVVNHDLASALGVSKDEGVLVLQVTSGGNADRVGIRSGDVITAAGEKSVGNVEGLASVLRAAPAQVTLHTCRRSDERDVTVSLVSPPTPQDVGAASAPHEDVQKEIQSLRQEIEALRAQLGATAPADAKGDH